MRRGGGSGARVVSGGGGRRISTVLKRQPRQVQYLHLLDHIAPPTPPLWTRSPRVLAVGWNLETGPPTDSSGSPHSAPLKHSLAFRGTQEPRHGPASDPIVEEPTGKWSPELLLNLGECDHLAHTSRCPRRPPPEGPRGIPRCSLS